MTVTALSEVVKLGFEKLIEGGDTREIGKFLAFPTENIIAPQWLEEECGVVTIPAPDDDEGQQAKYDRQGVTPNKIRIQVKYRGGKELHLEQTRRTTGKNSAAGAKNGQVRYSIDSFDVILFIIPTNYDSIESWTYLAVPAHALEDPKMPGYCVGRVPAAVKKAYAGKAKETILSLV